MHQHQHEPSSTETSIVVSAPAKINLHLKVLARETSGYHTIETVFHKLTLADDVRVTLRETGNRSVHCSVDVGPPNENLAMRAAVAFCEAIEWTTGFEINITKRIPAGGGLGGGSANAAATLHAMNRLSSEPLPLSELIRIGALLGADVPFLVSRATMAIAWGHGDRMLVLNPLPQRHIVLVIPDSGISTAEAYRQIDITNDSEDIDPITNIDSSAFVISPPMVRQWESLAPWVTNDFESVAIAMHPSIQNNIAVLRNAGAELAGLTGSGSVVFGVFSEFPDINAIARATQCRIATTQTAT